MSTTMMIQDIFNKDPECGFALRGDVYMWNMFRAATRNWIESEQNTDHQVAMLEKMIRELYEKSTGRKMEGCGVDTVEFFWRVGYGMSKGGIQREWWIEKGLPLLKRRLEDFVGDCTNGKRKIYVIESDIAKREEDVVVCPSNTELNPSGGVGHAIFEAAGNDFMKEVRDLPVNSDGNRCNVGRVVTTGHGNLKCRCVFHTVAPNCQRGFSSMAEGDLHSCYVEIFIKAEKLQSESVAIPSIGTGKNAIPIKEAARIAAAAVIRESIVHPDRKFVFCIQDRDAAAEYKSAISSESKRCLKTS